MKGNLEGSCEIALRLRLFRPKACRKPAQGKRGTSAALGLEITNDQMPQRGFAKTDCRAPLGRGPDLLGESQGGVRVRRGLALGWLAGVPLARNLPLRCLPWAGLHLAFGPQSSPAMPQSLARVIIHVVFSTKNRVPFLKDADLRARLYAYMAGILQNIGCEPILINGVEDHVHILCNLSRTVTIAKLVETVKHSPSIWMKEQGPAYADFFWKGGYGSFSVSQSKVGQVR